MDIHQTVILKQYTTMQLGGPARFFVEVRTADELARVYRVAQEHHLKVFILGGGSNIVVHDEGFDGLVIHMCIAGFAVVANELNSTTIKIGAGELWDTIVKRTVTMRLSGIEAMSGIPGTVGGTPITNVGAYGQEIADTLQSLEAFDTATGTFVTLTKEQCGFSYRHSIFRGEATGRYIITSTTLTLSKNLPMPPFYDSLQHYLNEHNITLYTHQAIRDAVLAIRASNLPNPTLKPNAGSFFKNAIVEKWLADELRTKYPNMPTYSMPDGSIKIPSGWLIEQTGLKGQLFHGIRVHPDNALVLVNESATSYADLAAAREEIVGKVRDTFRVQLEQEPLEV